GNSHINHSAHLWGAAYGIIVTILLEPKVIPHFLDQLTRLPF
ncbi:rhomboid family intramembrane serine protease, partial [Acinetobacter sp. A11]